MPHFTGNVLEPAEGLRPLRAFVCGLEIDILRYDRSKGVIFMSKISDDLSRYATMWGRNGAVACSGDPCQYKVPGDKAGIEITLYNWHARKGDWSATITFNGREICCNWHFDNAEDALAAAKLWIEENRDTVELTIRPFSLGPNDAIFIVDGLPSTVEVWIRNFGEGKSRDWRYQVRLTGDHRYPAWVSGFVSAEDALNGFIGSAEFQSVRSTLNYSVMA
jgi:hypothetical protein